MNQTYLMIDDDLDLSELMQSYFERFDIALEVAHHPQDAFSMLDAGEYQLVILDVMLPEMDGYEVCRRIREHSDIPIVMLTARGDLTDKVLGLELGCDDYLPKPFEPRELVARCQSLTRRANKQFQVKNTPGLVLNAQQLKASYGDQSVDLTAMEADALEFLIQNKGEVVSRDDLLNQLKGIDSDVYSRSIDILMSRLRSKLKQLTPHPLIYTARGKGYRYWEDTHESS